MRKICVATGTRAEYGLLNRLMRAIEDDAELRLQVLATNMHLSPEFGSTVREIEGDGFAIDKRVEMLLSGDTPTSTAKSLGLGIIGFADALADLQPDILLILGDRYEMLGVASTALLLKIPVAHLHGGEITEGAYDDAIRHAITKMSHLHFTATEQYRRRVIQLGENPDRVFNVGAIGVDNIRHIGLMSRPELEDSLGFELGGRCALVTYHPETLNDANAEASFNALLNVLDQDPELRVLFTKPNSDTGGRSIISRIDKFVGDHADRSVAFDSLGYLRYLSALQFVDLVVGNSSSGILEAPSFRVATINIGDRQKGRIRANSVIDCDATEQSIRCAFEKARSMAFRMALKTTVNPYEQIGTVEQIVLRLKNAVLDQLFVKKFYDYE